MNKTNLMRLISLMLVLVMTLSMVACDKAEDPTEPQQTTTQPAAPEVTLPQGEAQNPVTFFSLSLGENYENIRSMTAYANEDGSIYAEYVGDVKKVGTVDASVLHILTLLLADSGLEAVNGKDAYEMGDANGSMYITFADESMYSAGFSGVIPQAYTDGYNFMDQYFQIIMKDIPVYVPTPTVMEGVNPDVQTEMMEILNNSGMQNLDQLMISDVALDESFGYMMGLTETKGITSGTSCSAMMMTTAYSFVIATLEEGADKDAVCKDFENNLDWMKWVCVAPSNALIATKGNMVLCIMASGMMYDQTANAVANAGWTTVKTLENPNT